MIGVLECLRGRAKCWVSMSSDKKKQSQERTTIFWLVIHKKLILKLRNNKRLRFFFNATDYISLIL